MKFYHLHCHYTHSLLDSVNTAKAYKKYCKKYEVDKIAATDHGHLGGLPEFQASMDKAGIHGINGCELYVSDQLSTVKDKTNKKHSHLVVLARSLKGWKNLIKLVSQSNHPDNFYYKPRLSLEEMRDFSEDLIAFSGHPGSDLFNVLWEPGADPYSAMSYEDALSMLRPDWKKVARKKLDQYKSIFKTFGIEIQIIDKDRLFSSLLAAECLRELGEETNTPRIATADPHYPTREDAKDQQIVLSSALKTPLQTIRNKINNDEDVGLSGFFKTNNFHLWSPEEMIELHRGYEDEIRMTEEFANMCDKYSILSKPKLPIFDPTQSSENLLREICRNNWRDYRPKDGREQEYGQRIKMELDVINKAGLADYFLIVWDIINYAKSQGFPTGLGRGSAAGSLVLHLTGATQIDPIEHDLVFERFYNEGRNTVDNISLPDVDMDFASADRGKIIEYIRNRYGKDRTALIATYGRMQGKGAVKDVLRAHGACSNDEANLITKSIPDESAISDKLQEMVERGDDPSIIMWSLENIPDELAEYCRLEDDGTLSGPYAPYFEQAIRLEGTRRNASKHAAGVVISPEPLHESVPLIYDKDDRLCGFDKVGAELSGILKMDILAVSVLDKIDGVRRTLRGDDE